MLHVNYLDGFIYHMVHVDNLRSIFQCKALLSKEILKSKRVDSRSIAYDSVQSCRDVPDRSVQCVSAAISECYSSVLCTSLS
jgi:hypothetical protein